MARARLLSLCLAGLAVACSGGPPPAPAHPEATAVTRTHMAMGSELRLTAWTADEPGALAAFDDVYREFDRLENLMSVWREGSDIVHLNEAAGQHPVHVSPEVREVLDQARQVSDWTHGKFDVTYAALSGLWKFDYQDKDNRVPDPRDIAARLPLIRYEDLVVDDQAGTAFLRRKGMRVNLGGIGKGYAVDHAAAILRRHGFTNFLIQAGGDLYVSGTKDGQPWHLGIQDPRGPDGRSFAELALSNATFSTSGDYERFFFNNGRRYHHIIDPDTGQPAAGCRSVTIVTDRAMLADALSTGVFILGPDAGMALIEQLPNVEGVIVSARNQVLVSPGLRSRLILLAPPTDGP